MYVPIPKFWTSINLLSKVRCEMNIHSWSPSISISIFNLIKDHLDLWNVNKRKISSPLLLPTRARLFLVCLSSTNVHNRWEEWSRHCHHTSVFVKISRLWMNQWTLGINRHSLLWDSLLLFFLCFHYFFCLSIFFVIYFF